MNKHVVKLKKYWESDASFITLLVMLFFTVFILPILIDEKEDSTIFLNGMFVMLFILGMLSTKDRLLFIMSAVMVIIHVVLRLIRFSDNTYEFYFEERIVIVLNLIVFTVINFRLLFRDNEVNLHRVIGAVNVYLLVALIGSFCFEVMQLTAGDSLTGDFTFKGQDKDFGIFIYYSLNTITTLGIGDIIPITVAAKMLSVLLSAFGILYPAVVIDKMVSISSVRNEK
jgi:hypothetical protein